MMRDVLVRELSSSPDNRLCLTVDDRLPIPACGPMCSPGCASVHDPGHNPMHNPAPTPWRSTSPRLIATEEEAWRSWEALLADCDYFWPIAPESEGILHQLVRLAERHAVRMMASDSSTIAACADKWRLYRILKAHGLPCVETVRLRAGALPATHGWVAKPALGAGCEGCRRIRDRAQLEAFARRCQDPERYLLQPWMPGDALSLSALMYAGQAVLLACNRQQLAVATDGRLALRGVLVNAVPRREAFNELVLSIARLFPGLAGFVGIDIISAGRRYWVLEINPRLTTVIGGLSASLGTPVTALLQSLFATGKLPDVKRLSRLPVLVRLQAGKPAPMPVATGA